MCVRVETLTAPFGSAALLSGHFSGGWEVALIGDSALPSSVLGVSLNENGAQAATQESDRFVSSVFSVRTARGEVILPACGGG